MFLFTFLLLLTIAIDKECRKNNSKNDCSDDLILFIKKQDGASSSVVNTSAGKGACAVWSVFDPRPNHRCFQAKVDSQKASSLKQAKSHFLLASKSALWDTLAVN